MNYIDFHCDTAKEICDKNELITDNSCHISLDKMSVYNKYAQVMAIYISKKLNDDEGYNQFHEVYGYFRSQLATFGDKITLLTDGEKIDDVWNAGKCVAFLSVEDARLLNNDINRLDVLYKKGVRLLVFMWGGETCIGGSHNTQIGLKPFGEQVMNRCFELGIIPDVSHASEQTTTDMIEIAKNKGKPIIASHSNSYAVYPHTRNLRDDHFVAIRDLGGIVGISLCPPHLGKDNVDTDVILNHIEHYLSLNGENTVTFGCDFDGTGLPVGFNDASDLLRLADAMSEHGYSDELINKIFWKNAKTFLENNIK